MYQPLRANLREIRVLTVFPPPSTSALFRGITSALRLDMLECTISHLSLNDAELQSYETVSYVWGDPKPCRKIKIDGEVKLIPRNAEMALRTLALRDQPRVLWIDTLCINQADPEERANQVRLMGEIYSTTAQNLIYLGSGSRKTAHVDRLIEGFRTVIQPLLVDQSITSWLRELHARNAAQFSERFPDIEPTATGPNSTWVMHFNRGIQDQSFPSDGRYLPEGKLLESIYSQDSPLHHLILQNPWFRRAWTLQEAVLPSTSLCFLGDQTFDLDHLLEVVTWLSLVRGNYLDIQLRFSYGVRSVTTLFELRSKFEEERNVQLSRLMKISNQRNASDLRDMVFGTLGLSQRNVDRLPDLLAPDYTKSLHHVFRDATKAALLSEPDGLEVLYEVHDGKDPIEACRGYGERLISLSTEFADHPDRRPSWVPHWMSISADGSPPRNQGHVWSGWQRLPYIAAGNLDLKGVSFVSDDRPETILLCGSIIGKIRHVSDVFDFKARQIYAEYDALLNGLGAVPDVKAKATSEHVVSQSKVAFLECLSTAMNWSKTLFDSGSFGPPVDASADAWVYGVARTLIADTTLHGTRSTREALAGFMNVEHSAPGEAAAPFWEAARRSAINRCLAMTDDDLLVLGSCGTLPGDIVVRVEGGVYPFLLRQVDEDEYILVEHCYVDGAMPWQEHEGIAGKLPRSHARNFCVR